ncbi:hypothetical protein KVR01_005056 [Diaporthe batatas]|uniref:uncharacterized protein n=1 Tax=Diaporthe batatas TaxID=748121 RepID=UPI001D04AA86|nr:uncharacterized protein KVR01_005056 [Diaporthe batatas]KAG8164781.1 hypothetical protein KVR01_005056 [Diaporthe batatas]
MAGNTEGNAARSGLTQPGGVKAPADTSREDDALRYSLFLTQVCIKMFWRSLYAVVVVTQKKTEDDDIIIYILTSILFAADAIVQMALVVQIFDYRKEKPTHPLVSHAGCGAAFVFAYTLCFLPAAASIMDVFRVASWIGFMFNLGCLVELELGPFQKCVVALTDARAGRCVMESRAGEAKQS